MRGARYKMPLRQAKPARTDPRAPATGGRQYLRRNCIRTCYRRADGWCCWGQTRPLRSPRWRRARATRALKGSRAGHRRARAHGSLHGGVHIRAGARTRSSMAGPKVRRSSQRRRRRPRLPLRGTPRWGALVGDAPLGGPARGPAWSRRGHARERRLPGGSRRGIALRVAAPSPSSGPAPECDSEPLPPESSGVLWSRAACGNRSHCKNAARASARACEPRGPDPHGHPGKSILRRPALRDTGLAKCDKQPQMSHPCRSPSSSRPGPTGLWAK